MYLHIPNEIFTWLKNTYTINFTEYAKYSGCIQEFRTLIVIIQVIQNSPKAIPSNLRIMT